MKTISNYWILYHNWVLCNNDYFKLGELYDWALNNKLKASILITSVDQFYYRLVSVLYNILNGDGYFDEDYWLWDLASTQ
jgi:hypothetical protein